MSSPSGPSARSHLISTPLLLGALVVSFWFSLYVHVPLQAPYLAKQGAGAFAVGIIIGVYGFAQLVLRVPLGIRCDRSLRLYPYLIVGGLASPLSALFRLLFTAPWAFFVANLIGGVSAAMWIVVLCLYAQLYAVERIHQAMASAFAAYSAGLLLSTLVAALYARSGMKTLAAWEVGVGLVFFLLTVVVGLRSKREGQMRLNPPSQAEVRQVLCDQRLWAYSMLAFVHQGLILSAILSFASDQAKAIGATGFEIGLATFLYWVVSVLVGLLAGKPWVMRLGARACLPLSMGLAALYCLLLPHVPSVGALYALQAAGGIFGGLPLPFAMSEGMKGVPTHARSTSIGLFQAILAGGMVVMPPIAGALIAGLGFQKGFYGLAVIALGTAVYALYLGKREKGEEHAV